MKRLRSLLVLLWAVICLVIAFPIHQWFYSGIPMLLGAVWLFCLGGYFICELVPDTEVFGDKREGF